MLLKTVLILLIPLSLGSEGPQSTTPVRPCKFCCASTCDQGDGFYPEGDCAPCFCQCLDGVHYELCCSPGLVWNQALEQCDYTVNVEGCLVK